MVYPFARPAGPIRGPPVRLARPARRVKSFKLRRIVLRIGRERETETKAGVGRGRISPGGGGA